MRKMICISCPIGCTLRVEQTADGFVVTGNKCPRGEKYAIEEMTAPKRIVTSTVKITGGLHPVISVKTAAPVPKEKIFAIMAILANVELHAPVYIGDVVVKNIADTGIDMIATKNSSALKY
jgi:CxxC motif-containing protein